MARSGSCSLPSSRLTFPLLEAPSEHATAFSRRGLIWITASAELCPYESRRRWKAVYDFSGEPFACGADCRGGVARPGRGVRMVDRRRHGDEPADGACRRRHGSCAFSPDERRCGPCCPCAVACDDRTSKFLPRSGGCGLLRHDRVPPGHPGRAGRGRTCGRQWVAGARSPPAPGRQRAVARIAAAPEFPGVKSLNNTSGEFR
jgi:hypothetical protein